MERRRVYGRDRHQSGTQHGLLDGGHEPPYLVIELGALIAEAKNGGILNQQDLDDVSIATEATPERIYAIAGVLLCLAFFLAYLNYQNDRAYSHEPSPSVDSKQVRAVQNTVDKGAGLVAAVRPLLEAMEQQEAALQGASQSLMRAETNKSMALLQNVLKPFFAKYDADGSGTLETSELGRVFMDLNEPKSAHELEVLFKKFDADASGVVSFKEFAHGIRDYISSKKTNESAAIDRVPRDDAAPGDGDESEEEECPDEFSQEKFKTLDEQQAAIKRSAAYLCGVGTVVVLVFSDPISDVLTAIGDRIRVSAFYVAFVVAPLITNGSEVMASYTFAQKKTTKSMTVAYEQLLGAAVMNNTYCLFIFLILIASQGLYWNYTAEVIAILAAELCIFVVATQIKVHTMVTGVCVLAVYPATILLVWVLESLAGIS